MTNQHNFATFLLKALSMIPIKAQFLIGKPLGDLLRVILPRRLQVTKVNLKITGHGDDILNRHWDSLGISIFETANALFASNRKISSRLTIKNRNIVDDLIDRGENIMFLVPHTTHMLLAGRSLLTIFKTHNIYRPQNNKSFNHYMTKAYSDNGANLVNSKDVTDIIKALKSGTPVWYAPDQDIAGKQIFAPFFNHPTSTITATKRLATLSKANIVPLSFIRHNDEYILDFSESFTFMNMDEVQAATKVNFELEKLIEKAPDQYYWVHRRFKTTIDGTDLYKKQSPTTTNH